jgi:hypothetical protein
VLAVRAYVKAHASKRAIRVRERAPNIVECVPNSSSREDNVGLVVFRPDLLIGLSEGDVASQINGKHKKHQVSEAAHPNDPKSRFSGGMLRVKPWPKAGLHRRDCQSR